MMALHIERVAENISHHGGETPEGWERVKLPQVAGINMGQSPPGSTYNERGEGLPFFQGKTDFGTRHPMVRVWCTEPKKIAKPGDVLISVRAPVGPTNVADRICAIGRGLAAITPLGGIPTEFILFKFRLLEPELSLSGTGSTFTAINRKDLEEIDIDVPPLEEQKRIVAKAEELLARVNGTKERLAKVALILKRFRQAVLSAACSGRLTNARREQNVSKETGQDLLNLVLEERETHISKSRLKRDYLASPAIEDLADLPLPWAWSTVGQITKNFDGQRIPVRAEDRTKRKGKYPYYGASGIIDRIDDYLFDGDYLLIAEDGANLLSRSTPIAFRANGKFWVNNHAHIIQTYAGIPLSYLESYLNGIDLQHYVTGSAQPKLTQEAMNRIPVPVPPPREIDEIVRRVEALLKFADSIEKRVTRGTTRAESLSQAILAKTFRGELVPTEAELARREGRSYEPASALLARIKAERAEKGANLSPAGRSALKNRPKKVLTKSIN